MRKRTARQHLSPGTAAVARSASGASQARVPRSAYDSFDMLAALAIALFSAALAWVVFARHPVPLYQVETDLLGEYIPAARELLRGVIDPTHYTSKGVGYPLLLAAASALCGGDFWLGARAINLAAAAAVALLCNRLCRHWFRSELALAVTLALLVNPVFIQASVEAATDLTALAIALASMLCLEAPEWPASPSEPEARAPSHTLRLALAGFLAGFAVITRPNFAVLPLAAIALLLIRRAPLKSIAGYAAACALPVAAWSWATAHHPGPHTVSQNALNVAYEFYGNSMRDAFWGIGAQRFRSVFDVVRFDPLRFTLHWFRNMGTRWMQDVTQLLTLPIGIAAIAGIALGGWRGRRGWPIALHFVLMYAALATVFYLPRFSLFLVPLYLVAAAWLVIDAFAPLIRNRGAAAPTRIARWTVWLVLLFVVARQSLAAERAALAAAPVETRMAGEIVRRLTTGNAPVMASKPHMAYFAGQPYVPMGSIASYAGLLDAAHRTGARFLFYSKPETDKCPQLLGLLTPEVRMPGLEQTQLTLDDPNHYFALDRFTDERPSPSVIQAAGIELSRAFAANNPGDLLAVTTLADLLEGAGRPRDALAVIDGPARSQPGFAPLARFQALSYLDLGLVDSAGYAAERVTASPDRTGWDWGMLGRIRARQGRHAEARAAYARAVQRDPARAELRAALARTDSILRAATH